MADARHLASAAPSGSALRAERPRCAARGGARGVGEGGFGVPESPGFAITPFATSVARSPLFHFQVFEAFLQAPPSCWIYLHSFTTASSPSQRPGASGERNSRSLRVSLAGSTRVRTRTGGGWRLGSRPPLERVLGSSFRGKRTPVRAPVVVGGPDPCWIPPLRCVFVPLSCW